FFDVRDFCSAAVVPTDRWSHVVVTVNDHGVPTFYINGERVDTLIRRGESSYVLMDATSHPFGQASQVPLYLGANPPAPANALPGWQEDDAAFRGGLDHIAVYDRSLSEQEIQTHYSIGAGFLRP